ncbi:MAG: L-tyrosine/L-tryptophan isonitrile synthase family protein [Candidatus Micrarchaeota archaeon]|nr:L-tyrosine/L-tryptophan isonitrile synthase family protein [Candidatus Micrarchaeota archaeon]
MLVKVLKQRENAPYLSFMSGSLSKVAACSQKVVSCDQGFGMRKERINWESAKEFFVKSMPALQPAGSCLSERIFSIMIHERYMRTNSGTKSDAKKYRGAAVEKIRRCIRNFDPIDIVLPAFPMKGDRADMAEISAFSKFHELCEQIRKIYLPGARIHIIQDGMLHHEDFGRCESEVRQYSADLKSILVAMGLQNEIILHDLKTELERQPDYQLAMARAQNEIAQEIQNPVQMKHYLDIVSSTIAILGNSHLPPDVVRRIFTLEENRLSACDKIQKRAIESKAADAAFNFLVYGRAIEHLDLYERILPNAIRGSVHKGPGRIPLRFHAKGTTIPPWMGVAVQMGNEMTVKFICEVECDPSFVPVYVEGRASPFYFRKIGGLPV